MVAGRVVIFTPVVAAVLGLVVVGIEPDVAPPSDIVGLLDLVMPGVGSVFLFSPGDSFFSVLSRVVVVVAVPEMVADAGVSSTVLSVVALEPTALVVTGGAVGTSVALVSEVLVGIFFVVVRARVRVGGFCVVFVSVAMVLVPLSAARVVPLPVFVDGVVLFSFSAARVVLLPAAGVVVFVSVAMVMLVPLYVAGVAPLYVAGVVLWPVTVAGIVLLLVTVAGVVLLLVSVDGIVASSLWAWSVHSKPNVKITHVTRILVCGVSSDENRLLEA